jgi:AcrR family transcriptional regulator
MHDAFSAVMPVTSPPRTPRTLRTQAERRAASRARLLDAALLCLAERGYAGTTFPEVLSRAELSHGALWRHFRSKAELMVAAALYSEEQVASWPVPDRLARQPAAKRIDLAVEQVWRYVHEPAFQAWLELLRASRTDPELAELLKVTDERAAKLFFDILARLLGPELAAHPDFERNARLLGLSLYGVGLTAGIRRRTEERRLLAELKEMLRALYGY